MEKRLLRIAGICILVVAAAYVFSTNSDRATILVEIAKSSLQLLGIGILGAVVKWIFDEYNRSREQAAALHEFRKEILRALIAVTNQVRKAPVLIEATQTANTYNEQMLLLIDSKHELSLIQHEVQSCNAAFSKLPQITENLESMEKYLHSLINEFRDESLKLSTIKASNPEEVWLAIQKLPKFEDLMEGDEDSLYYKEYTMKYYATLDFILMEIWSAAGVMRAVEPSP